MPSTTTTQGSTRWCPTAEQLMILEEMYRGGLRTPNASQIQQITAHLALYGRIEGKNVFYWFQNHKARDRQKLRRRLCMSHHLLSCAHYYAQAHLLHHGATATSIAAAAPPPPAMAPLYSSDQHLLPTTATMPATAAYSSSYCYPFAAAATPPSRCATTSPPNPFFQCQGGGGVFPEYSLGRLGNLRVAEDACPASTVVDAPPSGYEEAMNGSAPPFCRPLKTLDLFPGGLKEEQRDVV